MKEHMSLQARIVEYVQANDWVTFGELVKRLGADGSLSGDYALYGDDRKTIVFWSGMSEAFSAAILDLTTSRTLFFWPASTLAYLIDGGGMLSLPVARRPPANGYKDPHWAPVCLRMCAMKRSKENRRLGTRSHRPKMENIP